MSEHVLVDAVPLRRLPPGLDTFTYKVPDAIDVSLGSGVLVPFKQSTIPAIIVSTGSSEKRTGLKFISGTIPFSCTELQLKLTKKIANHYYQSQATILNSITPVTPKRSYGSPPPAKNASKTMHSPMQSQYVLYGSHVEAIAYIKKSLKDLKGQALIIAPEHSLRRKIGTELGAMHMPKRTQKNEYVSAWNKIPTTKIIIGSERSLLLPFTNLQAIIVLDAEHSSFHTAEQNPHLRLPDILPHALNVYGCSAIVGGFSPDIRLLHYARKAEWPVRQVGKKQNIDIVVGNEQHSRNAVYHGTEAIIKESSKTLLIWNRLGLSRRMACKTCGQYTTCKACGSAQVIEGSSVVCIACGLKEGLTSTCSQCGGIMSVHRGKGVQSVISEVATLFPSRNIVEYSSKSKSGDIQKADVVVATNAIFTNIDVHFNLGVFLNPDIDLQLPSVYAAESLRHYLFRMNSIAERTVIQTQNPEAHLYTSLGSVADFYEDEIAWRKKFTYPPFGKLIQVSVKSETEMDLRNKEEAIVKRFAKWKPLGPFRSKRPKLFTSAILIKRDSSRTDAELDAALASAYTAFHVDINPYDLDL